MDTALFSIGIQKVKKEDGEINMPIMQ